MLLLLLLACRGAAPIDPGEVVPDFALPDVNPASPTGGQVVSPRDLIGQVSGYYFTYAG